MIFLSTMNQNERDPGVPLSYVVLHYTGMQDTAGALARMCDPVAKVSVHYLIDVKGGVLQIVDESNRAWHAGESFWRGETDMNSASIGIELVNPGHEFGYRPFPPEQMDSLKALLGEIVQRHRLSPALALLGHSDIAPARKQDPGEFFPWKDFADEGFGFWPQPLAEDYAPMDEAEALKKLSAIGYDIASPTHALLAFQRRYNPENLTGKPDPQTTAKLSALLRVLTAERLRPVEAEPVEERKQKIGLN